VSAAVVSGVDLVNAALLGTERRGVPAPAGEDAATWLLESAAVRRAEVLVAGATTVTRPGPPGPVEVRPPPGAAAREVLDELLLQRSTALVDLWLREARGAGVALAPEHWTPLLERARRSTDLDRRRLGAALGERGLWFARHNPAWSAVVRAATAPGPAPDATAGVDLATPAAQPDRLLTLPDPWSDAVAETALAVLAAGAAAPRAARALGLHVGTRVPLDAYARLVTLAGRPLGDAARTGLAAAEEVLWVRWGLARAFDPSRVPPERRPSFQPARRPEEHR